MFVRDFINASVTLEEALCAVRDPRAWERALASGLGRDGQVVLARFGVLDLGGSDPASFEVRVGRPVRRQRGTVVEVQWQPRGGSDWQPVMDGDVTLSTLSRSLVHLEFAGQFVPPGLAAAPADRIVQHRVVEYGLRLVLEQFVCNLAHGAPRKMG